MWWSERTGIYSSRLPRDAVIRSTTLCRVAASPNREFRPNLLKKKRFPTLCAKLRNR
jgi:hypothetical protein